MTLLHGPNGVGKTVVLQMINALLGRRFGYFGTVPFSRFTLRFHDGSALSLNPPEGSSKSDALYTLELSETTKTSSVRLDLTAQMRAQQIASRRGYITPHDTDVGKWVDIRDGEVLTTTELVDRYNGHASTSDSSLDEESPEIDAFLGNVKTHLIEAQRLVQLSRDSGQNSNGPVFFRPGRESATIPTVVERSRSFSQKLGEAMAQYGRESQVLDQSFPQRLLSATEELADDDLERQMSQIEERTAAFKTIGILDETRTRSFPVEGLRRLDPTQKRVMTLYVRDTEKKLNVLDHLATRARILLDSVNTKFRHKKVRLDRNDGLVAESDRGKVLRLGSLSSGEQHELVLHYDLLFRVPSNTVVLIDEPELSLHVEWQKRFLIDLLQVVELADLDALVATHSPYIVGDREDLMVALGDHE